MTAALATKAPSNLVPALGGTDELGRFSVDFYGFSGKNRIGSPVACDVLTVAAPAEPANERLAHHSELDLSTEATSGAYLHKDSFRMAGKCGSCVCVAERPSSARDEAVRWDAELRAAAMCDSRILAVIIAVAVAAVMADITSEDRDKE